MILKVMLLKSDIEDDGLEDDVLEDGGLDAEGLRNRSVLPGHLATPRRQSDGILSATAIAMGNVAARAIGSVVAMAAVPFLVIILALAAASRSL